jgi:vacuolar-type H+-ATPase subunit H
MTNHDLKKEILRKIGETEDYLLLDDINKMLSSSDKEVYELTPEQSLRIEEAKSQYSQGEYLTDDQAEKEIDEWLEE